MWVWPDFLSKYFAALMRLQYIAIEFVYKTDKIQTNQQYNSDFNN